MKNSGEQFLHQRDPKLHTTDPVEHELNRKKIAGEEVSQKPVDKISDFLEVIKKTHTGHREDPRVLERIKEYYHEECVIKPENIPESYFDNQKRIARELGHGEIEITEQIRQQSAEVIIADQKSTLDNWVNYFTSPDADVYPMWSKYWAFTNMLKLSTFDKEKHAFSKRDKNTVAPFPDLNREALAYVVDIIIKKANYEKIPNTENNPEFKKLIDGANFGKLYAYAIEKVTPTEENELANTDGKWVKYLQASDHMPLVKSLQGHGTGWCTAGESTAQTQLKNGDFYVYYSHDKQGEPTIPRVAIRMEGNKIGEVRGVAAEQNLDEYIVGVTKDKLKEFPDGKLYEKEVEDMKKVTEIDNKTQRGEELTKEDLRFIYEIDSKIEGFGYETDPRIEEILNNRDIKSDLSLATGYSKEQISTTKEVVLGDGIKFHCGDLNLGRLTSAIGLKLPKIINGNLNLYSLKSAEGLELPETINGGIDLTSLRSAIGLKLPTTINGNLNLHSLRSAEGLELPQTINGGIDLRGLTSTERNKIQNEYPKFKILVEG